MADNLYTASISSLLLAKKRLQGLELLVGQDTINWEEKVMNSFLEA